MYRISCTPRATRAALLLGALLSTALLPTDLRAQTLPTPPRPATAPRPPRPPRPAPTPRPEWFDSAELERAGAEMARAGEEMARAFAPLAQVQANVNVNTEVLRAASADMARQMSSLAVEEVAALASMGRTLGSNWSSNWSDVGVNMNARGYRTEAPAPWAAQDPADSLYRDARKALSGNSYSRAAELFKEIRQKYPRSSYASDAPYWEAFALQRIGGEANLRLAQDALGLQQRDYPKAATRGDAAALNARIEGMLARRGDGQMVTMIAGRARRAADDGCLRAEEDERIEALNALSQMSPEQAMPILKKVLARREPCTQALRRTAVWMVARQKQPEAASLLVSAAKNDPDREVREQAVFWLATVSTEEAVDLLIGLAKDGDDLDLRKRAVYALSRSKSERAGATLRDIAADTKAPDELRVEALSWYLRNPKAGSADRLQLYKSMYATAGSDGLKQTILRYIAGVQSDEARAYLVGLATNSRESVDVRRNVVVYIERLGGLSVVTTTTSRESTVSTLSSRSADFASIARSLWQVYEKTDEIEIQRQVLASLARVGDNAGLDRLIEVARSEKNPELRRAAVSYLSRTKDPRAIALLQEIINK